MKRNQSYITNELSFYAKWERKEMLKIVISHELRLSLKNECSASNVWLGGRCKSCSASFTPVSFPAGKSVLLFPSALPLWRWSHWNTSSESRRSLSCPKKQEFGEPTWLKSPNVVLHPWLLSGNENEQYYIIKELWEVFSVSLSPSRVTATLCKLKGACVCCSPAHAVLLKDFNEECLSLKSQRLSYWCKISPHIRLKQQVVV